MMIAVFSYGTSSLLLFLFLKHTRFKNIVMDIATTERSLKFNRATNPMKYINDLVKPG